MIGYFKNRKRPVALATEQGHTVALKGHYCHDTTSNQFRFGVARLKYGKSIAPAPNVPVDVSL